MMNTYTKDPGCDAKVGGLEASAYGVLDGVQEVFIVPGQQLVIYIHQDDDNRSSSLKNKYRMISMCVMEAELDQKSMDCSIPLLSCLLLCSIHEPQNHQSCNVRVLSAHGAAWSSREWCMG